MPEHYPLLMGGLDNPGHRSFGLFTKEHVEFAYRNPSIWDGTQFPWYTNFLYLDLDRDTLESLRILEEAFADYDYLIYASGGENRFHFIVPHNIVCHKDTKGLYQFFMAESKVNYDSTVLEPLFGVSLPGSINRNSGKRKELIKTNSGKKFYIEHFEYRYVQSLGRRIFRRTYDSFRSLEK
jgi:hypothetical protein